MITHNEIDPEQDQIKDIEALIEEKSHHNRSRVFFILI